ncbi:MAG: hypothetical protein AB7E55_20820 [Pigmentiphaga sp.]
MAALSTGPAQAGMKVLTHFANLSPYTAKIEFPRGMQDCWNDTGAEYDRHSWLDTQFKGMDLHAYEESFRMDMVSPAGHKPYLDHFKGVYGIADIADLKTLSMNNTSVSLAAGRTGERVEMALFRGETSAGASCKFRKSSRGFIVTLLDAQNQVVSRSHHEIRNPADGPWTLSRWSPEDPDVGEVITLGSGGQGRPVEVAIATVGAVITVASLGAMAAEVQAARGAARMMAPYIQRMTNRAAESMIMRHFLFGARMRGAVGMMQQVSLHRTIPAQFFATLVTNSVLLYARPDPKVQEADNWEAVSAEEFLQLMADPEFELEEPVLRLMGGLPEKVGDRSICLIEGDLIQLGVRICDVVGITLEILPNGSMVLSPLPSVGDGIRAGF